MNGLNVAPVSEIPPPFCAVGDISGVVGCSCIAHVRNVDPLGVSRGDVVQFYSFGDATLVECNNPALIAWGGAQPTSADVQARPYIRNGNVLVYFVDGRIGRTFTVTLDITTDSGVQTISRNYEIVL